jgi:hypothetical protein
MLEGGHVKTAIYFLPKTENRPLETVFNREALYPQTRD